MTPSHPTQMDQQSGEMSDSKADSKAFLSEGRSSSEDLPPALPAAHTPGPWTYTRNPENTRFVIDGAPSRAIAVTAGFEPDNEDNARLLAAAPNLLDKLADLCSHDFTFFGADADTANPSSLWNRVKRAREAIASARAAIALATKDQS